MWSHTFIVSFLLVIIDGEERTAPGVPPATYHDPSEFRGNPHKEDKAQVGAKEEHDHHAHGLGETMDRDHLKQHMKEAYVDVENLSERERRIQIFRSADLDNNTRLDGLELIKHLCISMAVHGGEEKSMEDMVKTADEALKSFDTDDSGDIDFAEYIHQIEKNVKR